MNGIEKNLHSKNRDRFTHGLSIFRREVNDVLKVLYLEWAKTKRGQVLLVENKKYRKLFWKVENFT